MAYRYSERSSKNSVGGGTLQRGNYRPSHKDFSDDDEFVLPAGQSSPSSRQVSYTTRTSTTRDYPSRGYPDRTTDRRDFPSRNYADRTVDRREFSSQDYQDRTADRRPGLGSRTSGTSYSRFDSKDGGVGIPVQSYKGREGIRRGLDSRSSSYQREQSPEGRGLKGGGRNGAKHASAGNLYQPSRLYEFEEEQLPQREGDDYYEERYDTRTERRGDVGETRDPEGRYTLRERNVDRLGSRDEDRYKNTRDDREKYSERERNRDPLGSRYTEDRRSTDRLDEKGTGRYYDKNFESLGSNGRYTSTRTNESLGNGRSHGNSSGRPGGGPSTSRYKRESSRVVYDGEADSRDREKDFYRSKSMASVDPGDKEFLGKVQKELESQRREWKGEIDRLTTSNVLPGSGMSTFDAAKNSMVDTSSGKPTFKAFVDVSEFPASSVKVNVDKLTNKVVVEARHVGQGGTAKTFTQRVQLPRFADDANLIARMNKQGILKIEVPLIYYFPETSKPDENKAKSFVYEVRTDEEGNKLMEILVNTGREMSTKDLKVEVEGDKLQIWAERSPGSVGSLSPDGEGTRSLIKQYTMPPNADTEGIKTERTRDGRLAILVPIF